jgi:hypothetical protein
MNPLDAFHQLDQILVTHRSLWCFEPFHYSRNRTLPGLETYPGLCTWLDSLTPQQITRYKADTQQLLEAVEGFLPDLRRLRQLTSLQKQVSRELELSRGLGEGIPGRKLAQIKAMGQFSLHHHSGEQWLEWCSGKGYLGRVLAHHSGQPVTSFEWQHSLCLAGQQEADAMNLPMRFIQGDALSAEAEKVVEPNQHAVALHACGDLHVNLLKLVASGRLPSVTLSPCCYHLTQSEQYQPLSEAGKQAALTLTKAELRIPLQETVTGGERVKRHRYQEMVYRLGLDLLLRTEGGQQEYQPVPSIKKSDLASGFEYFCHWAAERKGFQLPSADFACWEREGETRFWQMERLSLVQQLFRRALELWLVFDRALFLQENGYRVSVSEFCTREVTPRNILIHGERLETRD